MRNLGKMTVRALVAASVLGFSVSALAQSDAGGQPLTGAAKEERDKNTTLLRDFIHYVRINKPDLAAGMAQMLLNKGIKPTEFVDLVEASGEQREDRWGETMGRALRVPELEESAAALLKLYERGKLERVRNADEIARNITFLSGGQRARILAHERLVAAGEYAMPQLLEALLRGEPALRAQVQTVLVDMGQQAVTPLCTALTQLDPPSQELITDILGLIQYRTSLPYLYDVLTHTDSAPVKQACQRAIDRVGNSGTTEAADLYEQLGESYYAEKAELISFPGEQYQLLWDFQRASGLHPTAIRTEVYNEAMAMRVAERSLQLKRDNDAALALWLASNFSREIRQPAEYDNPAYPKGRRDAMYYAVMAGTAPCQAVLARGLDSKNTPLARRSIAAIEQTAGGNALWSGQGERKPLLDALRYPNRRVQYEAALGLGKAQPQRGFGGAERVVPLLASVIRDAGARFAAVVSPNREIGDSIRKTLEKAGYTVLPVSASLADLAQPIAEAPGVDLIVANFSTPEPTNALITEAHRTAKLAATPVLALVPGGQDLIDLGRRYERDVLVAVRPGGLNDAQLTEAVVQLVDAAVGGPIKAEEAREYAARSLSVLRDLAVSGNTIFDVGEAALPLIAALGETNGKMRLDIAEVLSRVDQKRTQVALMDAALNATGDDRVALLGKVADSAKRFGNLLEQRQVERVLELTASGPDKEATAAAALVGSLNLPQTNLVPLILEKKG